MKTIVCVDCKKETERTGLNHKRCSLCAIVAQREFRRRYRATPKGKVSSEAGTKRYLSTPKGKARRKLRSKRWRNNPKGSTYIKQYQKTEKGKAARFKSQRSFGVKHYRLKEVLIKEQIPKTDPLWSLNFHRELIIDGTCHYCLGPLSPLGYNLDRTKYDLRHLCYNVVPCCAGCNTIKGHRLSYKEMMLLVPALREIRRLRLAI